MLVTARTLAAEIKPCITTPPLGSQTLNRLIPFSIGSFGPTRSHFAQFANKNDFKGRCQKLTFGIPEEVYRRTPSWPRRA
ncbi:hypothetical protein diail_886 [Diaporthe ilicicola]|nr:hypothetical protein diail_886 [Diaporthe ilicicola]